MIAMPPPEHTRHAAPATAGRTIVCPGAARGDVSGGGRRGVKDAMLTDPTKTKNGRTKNGEQ